MPTRLYAEKKPSPARVLLITVDTLRADHLGCYGYNRNLTPFLDEWAKESLLYERCYSHASMTLPSLSSLMSGYFPHETQAITNERGINSHIPTLATILRRHGYAAAAVVSNYVLKRKMGFGRGYDSYDDDFPSPVPNRKQPEKIGAETTAAAIRVLEKLQGKPFFLWVHYMDPHGPYMPPEKYQKKSASKKEPLYLKLNKTNSGKNGIPYYQKLGDERNYWEYFDNYDSEISYLDGQLAALFAALKKMGLYDGTLIVLTADHGESLGEGDYYFCHGETLHPELLHVPLMIFDGTQKGRVKQPVQHADVFWTLLKTVHLERETPLQGINLLQLPESSIPAGIFSETNGYESFIRGEWMLVRNRAKGSSDLFNLVEETRAEQFTDSLRKEFEMEMDKAVRRQPVGIKRRGGDSTIDSHDREILKSLGY